MSKFLKSYSSKSGFKRKQSVGLIWSNRTKRVSAFLMVLVHAVKILSTPFGSSIVLRIPFKAYVSLPP